MFPLLLCAAVVAGQTPHRALVSKILASYAGTIIAFIGGLLQAAAVADGVEAQTPNVVVGIGLALVGNVAAVVAWSVPWATAPALIAEAVVYSWFAYYERGGLALAPRGRAVLMIGERLPCMIIAVVVLLLAATLSDTANS
jgi:hypothetical protein